MFTYFYIEKAREKGGMVSGRQGLKKMKKTGGLRLIEGFTSAVSRLAEPGMSKT